MAHKTCPKNITLAQWEQRKAAGAKGYAAYVRKIILRCYDSTLEPPFNLDRAAQILTGARRLFFPWKQTFNHKRGITNTTMLVWAEKLGILDAQGKLLIEPPLQANELDLEITDDGDTIPF